jgi:hypothetical protein
MMVVATAWADDAAVFARAEAGDTRRLHTPPGRFPTRCAA